MFSKIIEWYKGKDEGKKKKKKIKESKIQEENRKTSTHILLDFDSVTPHNFDKIVINDSCHVWLFTGKDPKSFSQSIQNCIQQNPDHIHIIQVEYESNPAPIYNNIYYYLGYIGAKYSQIHAMILSRRDAFQFIQNNPNFTTHFSSLIVQNDRRLIEKSDKEKPEKEASPAEKSLRFTTRPANTNSSQKQNPNPQPAAEKAPSKTDTTAKVEEKAPVAEDKPLRFTARPANTNSSQKQNPNPQPAAEKAPPKSDATAKVEEKAPPENRVITNTSAPESAETPAEKAPAISEEKAPAETTIAKVPQSEAKANDKKISTKDFFSQNKLQLKVITPANIFEDFFHRAIVYVIQLSPADQKRLQNKTLLKEECIKNIITPVLQEKSIDLDSKTIANQANKLIDDLCIVRLIEINQQQEDQVIFHTDENALYQRAKYFIAIEQPKKLQQLIDMICFYYLHDNVDYGKIRDLVIRLSDDLSLKVENNELIFPQNQNTDDNEQKDFQESLEKITKLIDAGHALPAKKASLKNLLKTYSELKNSCDVDEFIKLLIDKKLIFIHQDGRVKYLSSNPSQSPKQNNQSNQNNNNNSNNKASSSPFQLVYQYIQNGHALPAQKGSMINLIKSFKKAYNNDISDEMAEDIVNQLIAKKIIVVSDDGSVEYI